jgi:hypothetical protein
VIVSGRVAREGAGRRARRGFGRDGWLCCEYGMGKERGGGWERMERECMQAKEGPCTCVGSNSNAHYVRWV